MKVRALSASRLKTWLQCKYKYGCIYHKLAAKPVKETKDYLYMGLADHTAQIQTVLAQLVRHQPHP